MTEPRYVIQIRFLRDDNPEWVHFYSGRPKRTLRNARKELWYWQSRPWEDANRLPQFRIFDRNNNVAVEG